MIESFKVSIVILLNYEMFVCLPPSHGYFRYFNEVYIDKDSNFECVIRIYLLLLFIFLDKY